LGTASKCFLCIEYHFFFFKIAVVLKYLLDSEISKLKMFVEILVLITLIYILFSIECIITI